MIGIWLRAYLRSRRILFDVWRMKRALQNEEVEGPCAVLDIETGEWIDLVDGQRWSSEYVHSVFEQMFEVPDG